MDEIAFWYIISQSLDRATGADGRVDRDLQLESLRDILAAMEDAEDLIGFQEMVDHMIDQAYTWGLWGAAYLMLGGCSDDSFEYFRAGLILKGKEDYEAAIQDPDSLAEVGEVEECEEFLFLACEVYEDRSPDGAIYERYREVGPAEPAGDPFDEDDKDHLKAEYPNLFAQYGHD